MGRPKRADLAAIRTEVARIESEPGFDFTTSISAPAPIPDTIVGAISETTALSDAAAIGEPDRRPFGAWLLAQQTRKGWIADLAKWAKSDARYPKAGSADDVRKRLAEINAEGDAFEALDDAELDWLSH